MKISFVIPAYNEEGYVGECLASIEKELSSGRYDAEILVVNNASTDGTKRVAGSFPGVRIVDEPQKGLSRARHTGFAASSGDLIANIDADTIMPAGWLERMVREFERDEKLAALSGPFIYYDLPWHTQAVVRVFYFVAYLVSSFNYHILGIGAMLQGGNFVIRRSFLEKVGGYDTSIVFYGEDTDIARRLSNVGRVKWTFSLVMYTSGRRLRYEGILAMGARYAINYLYTTLYKKPFTKKYIDVRLK